MITPADADEQVERSRAARRQLAARRCECGVCTLVDVAACDWCDRMQPRCLLQEFCNDMNVKGVECMNGDDCEASR